MICTKHFCNKILEYQAGLKELAKQFSKDCHHLIYNLCESEEIWADKFASTKFKYKDYEKPLSLLNKIESARRKLCATWTKSYFTAGHTTNQRAELGNNAIKNTGDMKKVIRSHNLLQQLNHYLKRVNEMEEKKMKELEKLYSEGKNACDTIHGKMLTELVEVYMVCS